MSEFENDSIKSCKLFLTLTVDKKDALIDFIFEIKGVVVLVCDRSLDEFDYNFNLSKTIFLKYGDKFEEINEELFQIPSNEPQYNIRNILYELIVMGLPVKKLHPRFENVEDEDNEMDFSTKSEMHT